MKYNNTTIILLAFAKCLDLITPYLILLLILVGVFSFGFQSGVRTQKTLNTGAEQKMTEYLYTKGI